MVEYCSSVTNTPNNKSKKLSGHLLSDFAVFCSCIISHPLYLSYFLFFSPYLLKILAFLSPLFITTTLLLLSLLTSFFHDSFTFSGLLEDMQQLGFDRIGDGFDESKELEGFEEFEVYKIVFGSSTFDLGSEFPDGAVEFSREIQNPGEEEEEEEEKVLGVLICESVEFPGKIEEEICGTPIAEKILGVLISDEGVFPEKGDEKGEDVFAGERQDDERLDELLAQETSKCEKLMSGVGKAGGKNPKMADKRNEEVATVVNGKPLELIPSSIDGGTHTEKKAIIKNRSRRRGEGVWGTNDGHSTSKKGDDDDDNYSYSYSYSSSRSQVISPSLSNVGSMRKEKEWRRTLACKLFEERHNAGGGGVDGGGGGAEGMDMLWEAYEKTEENRGKQSGHLKKKEKEKEKKMRKGRVADYVQEYGGVDEDEDEEDEEEVDNVKLCCLQALKFSAGKMNFGMGRPGFHKISKAFKGIGGGWLSHRSNHQHSGGSKKGKSS